MVWSSKYKKSIDCNNPKGFSQRAHCRARKLRAKGVKTKSKPIEENEDLDKVNAIAKELKSMAGEKKLPDVNAPGVPDMFKTNKDKKLQEENESADHYAAIDDVHANLENRNHAIDEYGYGPLSPKETNEDFWNKKAELWNTSVEDAKKSRCYNCAAFNKSPKILNSMADALGPAGDKIVEKADLGFCEFFKFKCAGERTCDAWITNGPLKESVLPEEAPANAAGGGNIAGIGVPNPAKGVNFGEPGFSPAAMGKHKKRTKKGQEDIEQDLAMMRRAQPALVGGKLMEAKMGRFAGHDTFIVPSDMYHRARHEKKKGKHWKTYIGEDECGFAIREYASKNKKKPIILQDEKTGAMCYARYGK